MSTGPLSYTKRISSATKHDAALDAILERLRRLEQRNAPHSPASSGDGRPPHGVFVSSSPITPTSTADQASAGPSPMRFPAASNSEVDATAKLKDAIRNVQKLKLLELERSFINAKIEIPPRLAKSWIHSEPVEPRLIKSARRVVH